MTLAFSHDFDGIVWSTLVVEKEGLLVIEVRKPDVFETSLTAWDYVANTIAWEHYHPDEKWWVTPVAARDGVLLLQTYAHGRNPDHKGLVAIDIHTTQRLWQADQFAFHNVVQGHVLGFEAGDDWTPAALHIRTGERSGNEEFPVSPRETASGLVRPEVYKAGSEHFNTCAGFLAKHHVDKPEAAIEYIEVDDMIFMGYYVKEGEKLANYLLVIDRADQRVLHERLGEGFGVETFFVLAGYLIFVKNKARFFSYRIK